MSDEVPRLFARNKAKGWGTGAPRPNEHFRFLLQWYDLATCKPQARFITFTSPSTM
jgi:hypothetical protein